MLKSLDIKNLTVFVEANLRFSPHLNVIVGENGSGKSHLLKVAYAVLAASAEEGRKRTGTLGVGTLGLTVFGGSVKSTAPTKTLLQTSVADKLVAVLRPESLGRLARRRQGRERNTLGFRFDDPQLDITFSFSTSSKSEVNISRMPTAWVEQPPVFLPTRELLTIYPGFISIYENHYLEFEETWRDTCLLLGAPALRGRREPQIRRLLAPLEKAMGGVIELDTNGRFYLKIPGQGRMEMPLVAEGWRKLAMLARLIATGSLLDKGYLFWDEPETNLNPKLIKEVANTVLHLCHSGVQVFIATHSLFLMREFDIQLQAPAFKRMRARFFGLQFGVNGIDVQQGDSIDDIGVIAVLDEVLSQSDRYLETGA
jgi:energy-coupling factor transporter ATP-binding protein EcfA2